MLGLSKKLKDLLLPILSGILIGTSYIPFPPWALFFSLVPLWVQWERSQSLKKAFFAGWVTQFVLTAIGFSWIGHTLYEFGKFPLPIAYLGQIIFCMLANLYIPLTGMIWVLIRNYTKSTSGFYILLILPIIFWLMEIWGPTIFSWNFGYIFFWVQSPIYHLAEYIGTSGLSAIVIFINWIAFILWKHRFQKKSFLKWASIALVFVGGIYLWSRQVSQNLEVPDKKVNILIIQANIGNFEKVYARSGRNFKDTITDKYMKQTIDMVSQSSSSIDFIIWPETAFPNYLGKPYDNNFHARQLFKMIRKIQTPLITGAYSQENSTLTNSVFFIDERANYVGPPYHKTMLVPFGEYMPMVNYFPVLKEWFPQVSHFFKGKGPSTNELNGLKIGAQICYESLFPWFSVQLANQGAQIIVNVTNDSWYGVRQEPYQHLYQTLARAVELRRPLIRATNTGISTVVLASGEVLATSPLHTEWSYQFEVPYVSQPKTTFYQAFPWFLPFTMGVWLCASLVMAYREGYGKI